MRIKPLELSQEEQEIFEVDSFSQALLNYLKGVCNE